MKQYLFLSALLFVVLFITSCDEEYIESIDSPLNYSFFVAGHTYGSPGVNNPGLHPPFEAFYDTINNYSEMSMGFLTGDIVQSSTVQNWNEVDTSLKRLEMPIYFAFGNHDMQDRTLVENRYGTTYSTFIKENDLFIILDPNLANWNIEGEQLDFLKNTLNEVGSDINNIFVFFHQLIWLKDNHVLNNNEPNSFEDKADVLSFWTELEPRFNDLNKPVFLFAGDVGAVAHSPSLMYYKEKNLTYISSGMGYIGTDNFLIVEVSDNGQVDMKPVWLNNSNLSDKIENYPPL
ncbi:MAG: metallophosphoesterase family protein [Saprospiraceae bacterium]